MQKIVFALLLPLAGCVSSGTHHTRANLSPLAAVEHLEEHPTGRAREVRDVNAVAMNRSMKRFVNRYIKEFKNTNARVSMLKWVITHAGILGFQYDHEKTRIATEAYKFPTGNCLTLSNLFVAMARYLGIEAKFQEVSLGNSWRKQGDLYLLNRHINVTGRLPGGGRYVMDFIHIDTEYSPTAKVVSDERAKAQYYNNVGVEHLQAGDVYTAIAYFKKGIETAPELDYVWSNLGTAYGRLDELIASEGAFKTALDINSRNWSATNNLALVYQKMGRVEEAQQKLDGIARFRLKNPYYRFELSEHAYHEGDYKQAISHLRKAIALKPDEHEFYFALAKSYYRSGNRKKALTHFDKARELANSETATKRYNQSLDLLLEERS